MTSISKPIPKRPSAAKRWRNCPGSAALEAAAPFSPGSDAAVEGTGAHALAHWAITVEKTDLARFAGKTIGDVVPSPFRKFEMDKPITDAQREAEQKRIDEVVITREMAESVKLYQKEIFARLDAVYKNASPNDPDLCSLESRIVGGYGLAGTADCVVRNWPDRISIIDFKYGAGIAVDAIQNDQALCYAALVLDQEPEEYDEIEIVIVQPRTPKGSPVKVWTIDDPKYWAELSESLDTDLERAEDRPDEYEPGDHCRWCDGALRCPEAEEAVLEAAKPDQMSDGMSPADLQFYLDRRAAIREFLNQVEKQAEIALQAGEIVPGYKVVRALGNTTYQDREVAEAYFSKKGLKKICFESKLLAPGRLKTALKAAGKRPEVVDKYTHRPERGTKLAPEDDPRPSAVEDSAGKDFE